MSEESVTEALTERPPHTRARALTAQLWTGAQALDLLRSAATGPQPTDLLPAWFWPALAALGEDRLLLVTVCRDGQLVGCWPLELRRVGPLRVACRAGCGLLPYDGLRVDPHEDPAPIANKAWQALLDSGCADLLNLEAVPEGDPLLATAEISRWLQPTDRASLVDLRPYASQDTYLSSRSKNRRRSLRRRREQMEEQADLKVMVLTDPAERSAMVAEALALKIQWLVAEGRLGLSLSDGRLHSTLMALAANPSIVPLMPILTLHLNGQLAAVEIGFVDQGRCLSYLGAYDAAFARLGVGAALTLETIGWCIDQGLSHYDLLPPATPFKADWADAHPSVLGGAVPLTRLGRVAAPALTKGYSAAKRHFEALPAHSRDALRRLVLRLRR